MTTINEQGQVETWTAVYWSHFSQYKEAFDSLQDAWNFLEHGENAGTLSSVAILGPDGKVVMDADQLFQGVRPQDLAGR